jgi:hypothetical protein
MKTFLHVGCGPRYVDPITQQPVRPKGFDLSMWNELRLDINPDVQPDVVGTMTDMSAVPSGSVDAIFSSHNIEHLYPHEVPIALAEFKRVLRSNGFVVITCPDLQSVCALVAEGKLIEPAYISPAGPIAPLDILYGHRPPMSRGNLYMSHRCGFTLNVLLATFESAGFDKVVGLCRPQYFDLWALASVSDIGDGEIRELAGTYFPEQQKTAPKVDKTKYDLNQAVQDVMSIAIEHHNAGRIDDASRLYFEILEIQPSNAEANHNLGLIEVSQIGALSALPRLEKAVEANPSKEQFWVTYIDALILSGVSKSIDDVLVLGQQYGLKPETAKMLADEFSLTVMPK